MKMYALMKLFMAVEFLTRDISQGRPLGKIIIAVFFLILALRYFAHSTRHSRRHYNR